MPSIRKALARWKERWKKKRQVSAVGLGPGFSPEELAKFSQKPGRKLEGISLSYESHSREALKSKASMLRPHEESSIRLFGGRIEEKIGKYKDNSVRHFRMNMVLSSMPGVALLVTRNGNKSAFERIAGEAFRALVPGGRFRITDQEKDLGKAAKILERTGFSTKIWRMETGHYPKGKFPTEWQRKFTVLAKEWKRPDLWPYVLVAVKPRPESKNRA